MYKYKLRIKIDWWNNDPREKKIPEEYKNELEENALEQIVHQREKGFICGQLVAEIDNVRCIGWWEVK